LLKVAEINVPGVAVRLRLKVSSYADRCRRLALWYWVNCSCNAPLTPH